MKNLFATGFLLFSLSAPERASAALGEAERSKIDQLTGAKGAYTAGEDTHKVSFPRTDVKFSVEGRTMHPFLGFTSWAAFTGGGAHTMVMGDIVLLQDEVNPAMSAALQNGLEVTALHNHFFYDEPRVMYMHIGGSGNVEQLARAVRTVLDSIKDVRAGTASPGKQFPGGSVPEKNSITAAPLDSILGTKGETNVSLDGTWRKIASRQHPGHEG